MLTKDKANIRLEVGGKEFISWTDDGSLGLRQVYDSEGFL
jgi:hypothetical protein